MIIIRTKSVDKIRKSILEYRYICKQRSLEKGYRAYHLNSVLFFGARLLTKVRIKCWL
jgi:hypothetical protein